MAEIPDDERAGLSRREWLQRAGWVGAVVVIAPAGHLALGAQAPPLPQDEAPETLTRAEMDALEAFTARLIPTDENGPGAREARAARYIDRALGGALAASLGAYRTGLAALDQHARQTKDAAFTALSEADQDAVLTDVERNVAKGFVPSAGSFFSLVRTHTLQGTFGDPHYGGNANFVGWDLLGYPGIRLVVGPADQRLDAVLAPTHTSAYDHDMFTPRPPRAALTKGSHHAG